MTVKHDNRAVETFVVYPESKSKAPVVLQPRRTEDSFGRYGLYDLDVATGRVTQLLDTHGDDSDVDALLKRVDELGSI